MRPVQSVVLWAVVAALMAGSALGAEAEKVKPRIERVALFKNGLGYLSASATLPEKATRIDLGQLPIPSLGTFWVSYPKGVAVKKLTTGMEEVRETVPISGFAQLLAANVGRKVTIYCSKDMPTVEGMVVSAGLKDEPPRESPSPYMMGLPRQGADRDWASGRSYEPGGRGWLVVVKTRRGAVILNAESISRVDFEGADAVTSAPWVLRQPRIWMDLEKPAGGEKVSVSCLARGITWMPSYLVDLSDPKTARLTAKALIINEVADLEGVHLDLVTGFPKIQFPDVDSPVALTETLAGFFQSLGRGHSEREWRTLTPDAEPEVGNVPTVINRNYVRRITGSGEPRLSASTALAGVVAEDLFLYPVEGFSLRRDETAYVPLFTAETPYEHVYVWSIPDLFDTAQSRREEERERKGLPPTEEIWHCCRLTNNLKIPWTTAPVQFVSGGQFAGQDICFYTPPSVEATIRINMAVNLVVDRDESEVERKREAATFNHTSYDLVKLKGEIKLRNGYDKAVTVEVTKELTGEVRDTTPKAKDTPVAKHLEKINPHHAILWRIELKPNEQQTLAYAYDRYVRE